MVRYVINNANVFLGAIYHFVVVFFTFSCLRRVNSRLVNVPANWLQNNPLHFYEICHKIGQMNLRPCTRMKT